jgi:4,5-dihydroxyphthalate decarboxylase
VPPDKNLGSMMVSGELDAVMFYLAHSNLIDRSTVDLHNHPDIKPLFPDSVAEGVRYYRKTGLYPINHGTVIKRELAERHPWVITNVLKAFNEAAELADRQRVEHAEYYFETGVLPAQAEKGFAAPLIRHGVEPNRKVIETIAQYSLEQGLTPKLTKLEDLFAPSML